MTTGATDASPTTRYVHNALGQRVFKTEPLYPPAEGDESDQGFMASLIAFFTSLWNPAAAPAENLGFFYAYDEDGTLLGESGTGGANSTGEAFYLWMPTSSGPIPVMMISATSRYAIHADHLNTPRSLTEWNGALAWQWTYSAFGDARPTVAGRKFANVEPAPGDFEFNLRYPGQTADKENGLFYNYFRSYSPNTGRYTQSDPIGLDGGWNRFGYVEANPLSFADPLGLSPIAAAGAGGGAAGGAGGLGGLGGLGGAAGGSRGGYDPRTDMYTPPKPGYSMPGWLKNWLPKSELEECEADAEEERVRRYGYCEALYKTYRDYRTRLACEEKAFNDYLRRLKSCKEQCR